MQPCSPFQPSSPSALHPAFQLSSLTLEGWRAGRREEAARLEGCRAQKLEAGRLEGWKAGGLEGWMAGRLENWKAWKAGRLEGWRAGKLKNRWKAGGLWKAG